jgi:hypothetical protein
MPPYSTNCSVCIELSNKQQKKNAKQVVRNHAVPKMIFFFFGSEMDMHCRLDDVDLVIGFS